MQVQGEMSVNKLIVLFVFDKMESALSERTVVEMCTAGNTWLNYMDCMELFPKLVDNGFLCRVPAPDEEPLYTLTSDGRDLPVASQHWHTNWLNSTMHGSVLTMICPMQTPDKAWTEA